MLDLYLNRIGIALTALALIIPACALPGAMAPTPFAFPTPHLTLTAIFAPTPTAAPPASAPPGDQNSGPEPPPTATSGPPSPGERIRPNGRPVVARWARTAPQIDGDFEEWASDRYSANEVTFGIAAWSGGTDVSGTYMLAWDEDAFYLAVEVVDDLYVQASSGQALFRGDSVEVLLDMDLEQDFASRSLSGDDFQIGFSAGPRVGQSAAEAYRWFPNPLSSSLHEVEIASAAREDGYAMEIKLPWGAVNGVARPQAHFGFVLSISDNDLAGQTEQQSLVSSTSTRSLSDPTTWGTLILGSD